MNNFQFGFKMFGITLLVWCFCMFKPVIEGARILAVIPTHSHSHQVYYRPIIVELLRRGHEVVYVTTLPINDPTIKNLFEIDIGDLYGKISDTDFLAERWRRSWMDFSETMWEEFSYEDSYKLLAHPKIRKMYESKNSQKFDLFIGEFMWYHSVLGLAQVFDCPIVGVLSLANCIIMKDIMGLPLMPSHPSNWELGNHTGYNLPLFRRIENYLSHLKYLYKYRYRFLPKHNQIAKQFFGENFPDIERIVKNTSLIIVNHNGLSLPPVPYTGNIITTSGIHVFANTSERIPPKLQRLMDDAAEGFVYVSLGSNVQSKNLPNFVKQIFLEVFSNLPHKVLWKYEDDSLPSLPSNLYISKWMPQQSILGHPNIKIFIYQGGAQSTEEAIANGVPMVGLPVMADQDVVLATLSKNGIAKSLEITSLTKEKFDKAIREVITDKSFKDNALKAQRLFKDKPHNSLQDSIWWIEYVIRHKGTPFRHFSLVDDPWYSRYDEDVIAILSIISFIIICAFIITLIKLMQFFRRLIIQKFELNAKEKIN